MNAKSCTVEPSALARFATGRARPREDQAIARHLERCAACASRLASGLPPLEAPGTRSTPAVARRRWRSVAERFDPELWTAFRAAFERLLALRALRWLGSARAADEGVLAASVARLLDDALELARGPARRELEQAAAFVRAGEAPDPRCWERLRRSGLFLPAPPALGSPREERGLLVAWARSVLAPLLPLRPRA